MTIFWWVLAYTCAISGVGTLIRQNASRGVLDERKNQKSISLFFAILAFAFLLVVVGFRRSYNDTYAYYDMFIYSDTGWEAIKAVFLSNVKSKTFTVICLLFKTYISDNVYVWFFAVAIFQLGAIIRLYYKYSTNYFFSCFLFMASGAFTWLMAGIRQYLAICLVIYFIDFLLERKTIPFLIVVALASFIHISAIVWIPVYFVCTSEPLSFKMFGFALAVVGMLLFLDTFTNVLENFLTDTAYEGMTQRFSESTGVNPIRVLVSAVPWLLALVKRKELRKKATPFINILVNLSFIASAIYFFGIFTSAIVVGRLPMYFIPFNMILLPWVIDNLYEDGKGFGKAIKIATVAFYLGYFYYDIFAGSEEQYVSEVLGIGHL